VNVKIIAILGDWGTLAHRNKFKMNFEYSFFKPFFVKTGVIKEFLVVGDLAPRQSMAYGGLSAA
jgi:hypothetical protein